MVFFFFNFKFKMFLKFTLDKTKNRTVLKTALLAKLKTAAAKTMPLFPQISDTIFPKKVPVTVFNLPDHAKLYFVENSPALVELGYGEVFPHLKIAMNYPGLLRTVFVDETAAKAVLRGADLMAKGAYGVDETFKKNQIVQIVLVGQTVPLAISILMMDGEEILKRPNGAAAQTLHTLKDGLWPLKM